MRATSRFRPTASRSSSSGGGGSRVGYCAAAGNTNPFTGAAIAPGTFLNLAPGSARDRHELHRCDTRDLRSGSRHHMRRAARRRHEAGQSPTVARRPDGLLRLLGQTLELARASSSGCDGRVRGNDLGVPTLDSPHDRAATRPRLGRRARARRGRAARALRPGSPRHRRGSRSGSRVPTAPAPSRSWRRSGPTCRACRRRITRDAPNWRSGARRSGGRSCSRPEPHSYRSSSVPPSGSPPARTGASGRCGSSSSPRFRCSDRAGGSTGRRLTSTMSSAS